jgi:hypothetical protein
MIFIGENPIVLVQDGMLNLHGSDWSSIREARNDKNIMNISLLQKRSNKISLLQTVIIKHRYST